MSQGMRTRVVIGARYKGDFGWQQRAVRRLPSPQAIHGPYRRPGFWRRLLRRFL